jgi:hypothetical protein
MAVACISMSTLLTIPQTVTNLSIALNLDDAWLNCRHRPAAAAENQAAEPVATVKPSSQKGFKTFNEKDFVLEVPRGFIEQQSPAASNFGEGGRPKSTYGAPVHGCVRAAGSIVCLAKPLRNVSARLREFLQTWQACACHAERAAAITPLRVKFTSEDGQVRPVDES